MGEWSEYFEDFPEENPANWDRRIDPLLEIQKARLCELEKQREVAQSEIYGLVAKAQEKRKKQKLDCLLVVELCPECGAEELCTYEFSDIAYRCECQVCGVYGDGQSHAEALANTEANIRKNLDWRQGFDS
jgi:hypothetical protein